MRCLCADLVMLHPQTHAPLLPLAHPSPTPICACVQRLPLTHGLGDCVLDYRGVGGGSRDPQGHKAHGDEEAVPGTAGHLPRGGEHL